MEADQGVANLGVVWPWAQELLEATKKTESLAFSEEGSCAKKGSSGYCIAVFRASLVILLAINASYLPFIPSLCIAIARWVLGMKESESAQLILQQPCMSIISKRGGNSKASPCCHFS